MLSLSPSIFSCNPAFDKGGPCMIKNIILKVISIVLALTAIFAIACAASVTGGGFLDLSNIVRVPCIILAVISGILAVAAWIFSRPKC